MRRFAQQNVNADRGISQLRDGLTSPLVPRMKVSALTNGEEGLPGPMRRESSSISSLICCPPLTESPGPNNVQSLLDTLQRYFADSPAPPAPISEFKASTADALLKLCAVLAVLSNERQNDRRLSSIDRIADLVGSLSCGERAQVLYDFERVAPGVDPIVRLQHEIALTRAGIDDEIHRRQKRTFGEAAVREIDTTLTALTEKVNAAFRGDQTALNASQLRLIVSKLNRAADFAEKEKIAYQLVGALAALDPAELQRTRVFYCEQFHSELADDLKIAVRWPSVYVRPSDLDQLSRCSVFENRVAAALSVNRAAQIDALFQGNRRDFLAAHLAVVSQRYTLGGDILEIPETEIGLRVWPGSFRKSCEREYQSTLYEIGKLGKDEVLPALESTRKLLGANYTESGPVGIRESAEGFKQHLNTKGILVEALIHGDQSAALFERLLTSNSRDGVSGAIAFIAELSSEERASLNSLAHSKEFRRWKGSGIINQSSSRPSDFDSQFAGATEASLIKRALETGMNPDLNREVTELKDASELRELMEMLSELCRWPRTNRSEHVGRICGLLSVMYDPEKRARWNELFVKYRATKFPEYLVHPSANNLEEGLLLLLENKDGHFNETKPWPTQLTPQSDALLKSAIRTGKAAPATLQAARLAEVLVEIQDLPPAERSDAGAALRREFLLLVRAEPELMKKAAERFKELSAERHEERQSLTNAVARAFAGRPETSPMVRTDPTAQFIEAALRNDIVAIKRINFELTIRENDIRGAALLAMLRNIPAAELKQFSDNFTAYSKEGWHSHCNLDAPDGGYAAFLRMTCGHFVPDPETPPKSEKEFEHIVMTDQEHDFAQRLFTGERSLGLDQQLANYALNEFGRFQSVTPPNPALDPGSLDYRAALVRFERNAAAEQEGIAFFNLLIARYQHGSAERAELLKGIAAPDSLSSARKEIVNSILAKGSVEVDALMGFVERVRKLNEAVLTGDTTRSIDTLRRRIAVTPRGTTFYQEQLRGFQHMRNEAANYSVISYLSGLHAMREKDEVLQVARLAAFTREKQLAGSFLVNGGEFTFPDAANVLQTIQFSSLEEGAYKFREAEAIYRRAEARYTEIATEQFREMLRKDPDLVEDRDRAREILAASLKIGGFDKDLQAAVDNYLSAVADVRNLHVAIRKLGSETRKEFGIDDKRKAFEKELEDTIERLDNVIQTMRITQDVLIATVVVLAPLPPPLKFALGTGLHGIANFGEGVVSVVNETKNIDEAKKDWGKQTWQQGIDTLILSSSLGIGGLAQGRVAARYFPEAAQAMKLIHAGDKTARVAFVPRVALGATSGGAMMTSSNVMHLGKNWYDAEHDFSKLIEGKHLTDEELQRSKEEFYKARHLDPFSIAAHFMIDGAVGTLGGGIGGATQYFAQGRGRVLKIALHTGDIGLQLGLTTSGEAAKGTLYILDETRPREKRLNWQAIYSNTLMLINGKGGELKHGTVGSAFKSWQGPTSQAPSSGESKATPVRTGPSFPLVVETSAAVLPEAIPLRAVNRKVPSLPTPADSVPTRSLLSLETPASEQERLRKAMIRMREESEEELRRLYLQKPSSSDATAWQKQIGEVTTRVKQVQTDLQSLNRLKKFPDSPLMQILRDRYLPSASDVLPPSETSSSETRQREKQPLRTELEAELGLLWTPFHRDGIEPPTVRVSERAGTYLPKSHKIEVATKPILHHEFTHAAAEPYIILASLVEGLDTTRHHPLLVDQVHRSKMFRDAQQQTPEGIQNLWLGQKWNELARGASESAKWLEILRTIAARTGSTHPEYRERKEAAFLALRDYYCCAEETIARLVEARADGDVRLESLVKQLWDAQRRFEPGSRPIADAELAILEHFERFGVSEMNTVLTGRNRKREPLVLFLMDHPIPSHFNGGARPVNRFATFRLRDMNIMTLGEARPLSKRKALYVEAKEDGSIAPPEAVKSMDAEHGAGHFSLDLEGLPTFTNGASDCGVLLRTGQRAPRPLRPHEEVTLRSGDIIVVGREGGNDFGGRGAVWMRVQPDKTVVQITVTGPDGTRR